MAITDRYGLALEMGADDFVRKPYELKDLVARIRHRLGGKGEAAA